MSDLKDIKHPNNPFCGRVDDYQDEGRTFDHSLQAEWIHKQIIIPTCQNPGEDDFVLDERPFKVGEHDLQKEINEAAKGASLKEMLAQVMRTGDDSILHAKGEGVYIDTTALPRGTAETLNFINEQKALAGDDFETIGKMSKDEITLFVKQIVESQKIPTEGVEKEAKASEDIINVK